jgi:hypothetical protein
MKALAPIAAGEEIFNDYGKLPRSDLLRRYGYITPNYAQYDAVEISFHLIVGTIKMFYETGRIETADDFEDKVTHSTTLIAVHTCLHLAVIIYRGGLGRRN